MYRYLFIRENDPIIYLYLLNYLPSGYSKTNFVTVAKALMNFTAQIFRDALTKSTRNK